MALGLVWRFGWIPTQSGAGRRAVASAHGMQGQEVHRWDLGLGTVQTVMTIGERLCVVLGRDSNAATGSPAGGRLLVLDPTSATEATVLLPDNSVDITDSCWSLPARPLEDDSYLAQTLADNSALENYWHSEPDAAGDAQVWPLAAGLSGLRAALVGEWPHTRLQWTFSYAPYPGLVLRRQVSLFDELGRPDPPQYADINLMEDLDTRNLPPATEARDGVLDV